MESPSNQEMSEYIKEYSKRFKSFIKKLTPEELDVLMNYKGSGFVNINAMLYGEPIRIHKSTLPIFFKQKYIKNKHDQIKESIRTLDNIFNKVPKTVQNKIPPVLYRGSNMYSAKLKVGTTFVTSGFTSTSLVPYIATNFIGCEGCCVFKFLFNTQIPYIYVSWNYNDDLDESIVETELEILLPRNLEFKIVNIEKVSLDSNHIFCTQKEIQKSKSKKITMYTCEFVEELKDKSIPDVGEKLV
jgi:hypothetical protein